jgi:hypothetical protein
MKFLIFGTLFLSLAAVSGFSQELTVSTIIARSVAANEADWKAAPQFACFVKEQEDKGTRTYEELMMLGSHYRRLVAVHGKPLSAEDQKKEEQKLQEELARRQRETPRQRAQRIAEFEKERNRDHQMMEELIKAFTFQLLGTEELRGEKVYVLQAVPRPNYHPPNLETKVLKGMQGKLWIDVKDFQWAKVEAEAVHPVSIEGFFAEVEPGTRFELEKAPVDDGIWLARHFAMKSRAKILRLFPKRNQEEETYFNCHKQKPIAKEIAPPLLSFNP